jgi:hypothetical protein
MLERRTMADRFLAARKGCGAMVDVVFVVLTLLFFIVGAAYVSACERIT